MPTDAEPAVAGRLIRMSWLVFALAGALVVVAMPWVAVALVTHDGIGTALGLLAAGAVTDLVASAMVVVALACVLRQGD